MDGAPKIGGLFAPLFCVVNVNHSWVYWPPPAGAGSVALTQIIYVVDGVNPADSDKDFVPFCALFALFV